MSTTISTGSVGYNVTTSRPRFTKGEQTVDNAEARLSEESVVLSGAAPTEPVQRFSQLPAETRGAVKDITKKLASDGRLFVRDEQGLRRANPMEIKERLDKGLPIEVVTREGSENSFSSSAGYAGSDKERGFFTEGYHFADSHRSSSSSTRVFYSASPVTEWDSLEWADLDARGVQGVARLPQSGGSVVVSSDYERSWSSEAHREWGLWNTKSEDSGASGYTRVSHRAD